MQAFYMYSIMINTLSKDIENKGNKNSQEEWNFDNISYGKWLQNIQQIQKNEKKTQKNKTKKLKKILLDNNGKDYQQFLALNPEQFDQWPDGRRKITSEAEKMYLSWNKQQAFEIFNKQVKIIDYYIDKYPKERPDRPSKELLRFHQVQLLAFQGKNEEAIKVIKWIHRKNIGISEIYYKATLAFLEHDKETLQKCCAEKNNENHEFIKRFLDAIDINKTYLETYGNI